MARSAPIQMLEEPSRCHLRRGRWPRGMVAVHARPRAIGRAGSRPVRLESREDTSRSIWLEWRTGARARPRRAAMDRDFDDVAAPVPRQNQQFDVVGEPGNTLLVCQARPSTREQLEPALGVVNPGTRGPDRKIERASHQVSVHRLGTAIRLRSSARDPKTTWVRRWSEGPRVGRSASRGRRRTTGCGPPSSREPSTYRGPLPRFRSCAPRRAEFRPASSPNEPPPRCRRSTRHRPRSAPPGASGRALEVP